MKKQYISMKQVLILASAMIPGIASAERSQHATDHFVEPVLEYPCPEYLYHGKAHKRPTRPAPVCGITYTTRDGLEVAVDVATGATAVLGVATMLYPDTPSLLVKGAKSEIQSVLNMVTGKKEPVSMWQSAWNTITGKKPAESISMRALNMAKKAYNDSNKFVAKVTTAACEHANNVQNRVTAATKAGYSNACELGRQYSDSVAPLVDTAKAKAAGAVRYVSEQTDSAVNSVKSVYNNPDAFVATAREYADAAQDATAKAASAIHNNVSEFASNAATVAKSAYNNPQEFAVNAKNATGKAARNGFNKLSEVAQKSVLYAQENPGKAAAIAAGTVVALYVAKKGYDYCTTKKKTLRYSR